MTRQRLKFASLAAFAGLLSLSCVTPAFAAEDANALSLRTAVGNIQAGKGKAQGNVCQECHNPDGNSTVPEYPRLSGQYSQYILKQLRDFQSGARKHQIMNAVTQGFSDTDFADISAWFASNPVMQGEARSNPLGKRLFEQGDAARQVLACASCHGADGKGALASGAAYPAIGGQHRFYLRGQLLDWKSGVRQNSAGGIMNTVARSLSDADIEALSEYLSGL